MTTTVLLGTAESQSLPTFSDSVDSSVLPTDNAKCGAKEFSIALVGGGAVPGYLVLSGTTLSLQTDDVQYIGTHAIELTVTMADYAGVASLTETFNVVIAPCVPTLTPVSIAA